jgi:hypothetical protein
MAAVAAGEPVQLYAPLGIGRHVDHLLVFEAGSLLLARGFSVLFYEDFPYARHQQEYERRLAELPGWEPQLQRFGERALRASIDAFGYYRSQHAGVFPGESYEDAMRAWAVQVSRRKGGAERFWAPPPHR